MRLVFDNIIFSLQRAGGISLLWSELIKRFLNEKNIEFRVIESKKRGSNLFRNSLNINEEKIIWSRDLYKVERYLSPPLISFSEKFIFHSSYYRTSKQKSAINITTVHDFAYKNYRKGLPRLINFHQIKAAVKESAGIICISENTKRDIYKFIPEVNQKKVIVVPNGVSDSYFRFKNHDKSYFKFPAGFNMFGYVLFIGDRRAGYKNFFQTVIACKKFNKIPLIIIGGGPLNRNEKKILEDSLGIKNFLWMGIVTSEILNHLYNFAFCLVYPSSYEGFGIPILEAQKAGCPVICLNASSIPEVVGESALLLNNPYSTEIAEKMAILSTNDDIRRIIIESGEKNSQRFSWDKTFLMTRDFYKEIYESF